MTPIQRLSGRVAIVTGGGSGIGRATALRLASEGARVLVTGRRQAPLEETVALIRAAGGDAAWTQADATVEAQVRDAMAHAMSQYGRLDILFNNAGISGQGRPLCEIDEAAFEATFANHAKGVWLGMKHAIPQMIKGGGGAIINMSSMAGLVGSANNADYAAAMWGVIGLTKCAAVEYARHNVRVNAVCPAAHESAMLAEFRARFTPEQWQERTARVYPRGRTGVPEEVASVVAFLASDDAANMHGVALPVDGGFTAQ